MMWVNDDYFEKYEAELTTLRQELHQAKAEWFEEKKRAREAEQDRDNWMGVAQNNTRKITKLHNHITELENITKLTTTKDDAPHLALANKQLREELGRVREGWKREHDDLKAENARLREEVKEANEQAEGLGEARDRLREELDEAQRKYILMLAEKNTEIARLREQGGLLTEQVIHMDNEIISLLEELDRHHPTIPCTICGE